MGENAGAVSHPFGSLVSHSQSIAAGASVATQDLEALCDAWCCKRLQACLKLPSGTVVEEGANPQQHSQGYTLCIDHPKRSDSNT